MSALRAVIPAKAGTQTETSAKPLTVLFGETLRDWVPAFAGMTVVGNAIA